MTLDARLVMLLGTTLGACGGSDPPATPDAPTGDAAATDAAIDAAPDADPIDAADPLALAFDLLADGSPVTNAKLIAAGYAYSEEGGKLATIVRFTFTAVGGTAFDAELAITNPGVQGETECFFRMGGGDAQFSSTRTGGSCSEQSALLATTTDPTLRVTVNGVLSSAAAAAAEVPAGKMQIGLTQMPDAGTGNLTNASIAVTGTITLPSSATSRMKVRLGANTLMHNFTALPYDTNIEGTEYKSVLGVSPRKDGSGAFTGYEFVQVVFTSNDYGTGGSCESSGPTVLFHGMTDSDSVPVEATIESSIFDATVNCSVSATATTTKLTGTFAGTTKTNDQTSTTVFNDGSYEVFLP